MIELEGIEAKLARAQASLESLQSEIAPFCERKISEVQSWVRGLRERSAWLQNEPPPDLPAEWSVLVGEISYQLRSTLDHLIWQLVVANGKPPSTRNQFPIFLCEDDYLERARGMLKGVSAPDRDRIAAFQPFNDEIEVAPYLWVVHNICNVDKHRHLNLTTEYSTRSAHLEAEVTPGLLPPGMREGLGLFAYLGGTGEEHTIRVDVSYDVCFREEYLSEAGVCWLNAFQHPTPYPPVMPVLTNSINAVRTVVRELADPHVAE